MEQIRSEIRRAKKEKFLWEKDTTNWSSGLKIQELTNKIKELEEKLYDMEYKELEALEKQEGLDG